METKINITHKGKTVFVILIQTIIHTMSAGELSLASDEWAWLRTPEDFLRARAPGSDVTLPW